jgi:tetratricopeptide (TPR) repeat protein|tara:strand:- start:985 stop:1794 length:810 start_codon:yes stop_codon:yes gene_type:complete
MWLNKQRRISQRHRLSSGLAVLFALLFLVGCPQRTQELLPEIQERAYRRGQGLQREGNHREALIAFEEVIAGRAKAPESHLEVGLIYLNKIKDPVSAYYHFNRYLTINPNGEHANRVKEQVTTAVKDFMRSLPGEPLMDEVERLDVYTRLQSAEEHNTTLRAELSRLRRELAQWQERSGVLEQQVAAVRNQPTRQAPLAPIVVEQRTILPNSPAAQSGRTYAVQAGDTLSKISREIYGNAGKWQEIFEANRNLLPSQNALRPGQVLRIP